MGQQTSHPSRRSHSCTGVLPHWPHHYLKELEKKRYCHSIVMKHMFSTSWYLPHQNARDGDWRPMHLPLELVREHQCASTELHHHWPSNKKNTHCYLLHPHPPTWPKPLNVHLLTPSLSLLYFSDLLTPPPPTTPLRKKIGHNLLPHPIRGSSGGYSTEASILNDNNAFPFKKIPIQVKNGFKEHQHILVHHCR